MYFSLSAILTLALSQLFGMSGVPIRLWHSYRNHLKTLLTAVVPVVVLAVAPMRVHSNVLTAIILRQRGAALDLT